MFVYVYFLSEMYICINNDDLILMHFYVISICDYVIIEQ